MKILICSLNSSYTHTSLSAAILHSQLANMADCTVAEFTINQKIGDIVSRLYNHDADIYMFSCYIWNIKHIRQIAGDLKKLKRCLIVWGGSEVSFNPHETLIESPEVDYILSGESEFYAVRFMSMLLCGENVNALPNVFSHKTPDKKITPQASVFAQRKLPYTKEFIKLNKNKILYYETARGCPYRCSYCLSSIDKKMRFVPVERVFDELKLFIGCGARQVKFIDRTFNANPIRARQIIQFILDNNVSTNFHFEMCLDTLDDKTMDLLIKAPVGYFQIEAGLQSINCATLEQINRKNDLVRFAEVFEKLRRNDNIHIHADLIAMLPHETLESFLKGYDYLFCLKPHMLQLGFLKMIKGTPMRKDSKKLGMIYSSNPPYETLATPTMNFEDYQLLKKLANLTEKYLNSGCYETTLSQLQRLYYPAPHSFMLALIAYFEEKQLFDRDLSKQDYVKALYEFMLSNDVKLTDNLAFDYIKSVSLSLPDYLGQCVQIMKKEEAFRLIKANPQIFEEYITLSKLPAKEIYKKILIVRFKGLFNGKTILFVNENEYSVSKHRKHKILTI